MTEQDIGGQLPAGVWFRRLPWKAGVVTFIHNFLNDNILTKFEFELVIAFPVTVFFNIRYREFYTGSEVPEHRDAFEPVYGCSVSLLTRRARRGGQFKCEKLILKSSWLNIFNGTRYLHSVSRIEEGSRKSLIGCLHFAPWPTRTGAPP
jgi:hypothetical protein